MPIPDRSRSNQPTHKKRLRSSSLKTSCLALLLAAWGSHQASAGSIVRLFYDNITGTAISDLTSNAIFPNGSTGSETLTQFFEGTTDTAAPENFGSWIRGYLEAPQTGNYTFWVASDDPSQLWLSTDTTQAHTNLIAYVPDAGYTGVREYTKYASQLLHG
jgi:xyloglucan-specific exo-beta-1,4-glucanase